MRFFCKRYLSVSFNSIKNWKTFWYSGVSETTSFGLAPGWVGLLTNLFSFDKSTHTLIPPPGLWTTIMGEHYSVALSPTGCIILWYTILLNLFFVLSWYPNDILLGVDNLIGLASSVNLIILDLHFMIFKVSSLSLKHPWIVPIIFILCLQLLQPFGHLVFYHLPVQVLEYQLIHCWLSNIWDIHHHFEGVCLHSNQISVNILTVLEQL